MCVYKCFVEVMSLFHSVASSRETAGQFPIALSLLTHNAGKLLSINANFGGYITFIL